MILAECDRRQLNQASHARRFFASIAIAFLALLLTGCGGESPQSDLRTVPLQIGGKSFTIEVADTFLTREHGLMQRDSMPELHGMLFVFDHESNQSFWMKNTRIPLDILFLDHDGHIISLATMRPYDLGETPSNGPAKYAIELNAGMIQKTGVQVGQTVAIPADAREPKP